MSTSTKAKSVATKKAIPSHDGSKKSPSSALGAPSQHKQASRKRKRAWRKNVDIGDVEEGLEELRAEERVTGSTVQKKTDGELFQIDVKGDEKIRATLARPRFSTSNLTSSKILAQRSAAPAVFSRRSSGSSTKRKKSGISYEEKGRLLRIAKKPRRGPFNARMDPEESVMDVSDVVKMSGGYDPWAEDDEVNNEDVPEGLKKRKIKAPPTIAHPRTQISLPAIAEPHQGTSYNPPVSAHQELLLKAHEIEERRLKEEDKLAELKKKMDDAVVASVVVEGVPPGMKVDEVKDDEQEDEAGESVSLAKPTPKRKTQAQRNKAARLLAEKRALTEKASKKRLQASIYNIKSLRRAADLSLSERQATLAQRRVLAAEKLKHGMTGKRLGKHMVREGEVDVQLGEDLSESLRGLKPEGNLFRDRMLSMQQRALVEPRALIVPRRKARTKEYEKHPWKRFDRE